MGNSLKKTICRPPRAAQSFQKGRRLLSPLPASRTEFPTVRAPFCPIAWQRERVQRLARICRCIDRGRQQGKSVHKMLVKHAWRWKVRYYKSDPARPIRFSASTLLRVYYYQWRRGGHSPAAIVLRYGNIGRKLSAVQMLELARACMAPDVQSFRAAYRKLESPGATESAYRYATPARLRATLARLFAHRRREQVVERAARQLLARMIEPGG